MVHSGFATYTTLDLYLLYLLSYIFLCNFFNRSISRNGTELFQKCPNNTGRGCVVAASAFWMPALVWLISTLRAPFQGCEEHQTFFLPVTCFEVCLLRVLRLCLHLVLGQRWKACTSADLVSKIPVIDPFMLTRGAFLVHGTSCLYMTHLYWHKQERLCSVYST